MSNYVLDACALLVLLRNEPGADIVADALNAALIESFGTGLSGEDRWQEVFLR